MMQCFYLERTEDKSGVSGTGRVAEGVQLPSGRVVIEWLTSSYHSIGIYESMCALLAIHGHNGATNVVFIDERIEDNEHNFYRMDRKDLEPGHGLHGSESRV